MTRRKKNDENGTTATLESPTDTPVNGTPVETTAVETTNGHANGNGQERKPIKVFSYLVGPDTYVQVSVWMREGVRRDQTTFTTYDTSLRKRYLDHRDQQWKSLYSLHASEIYAALHGLQEASKYIAELRAADVPF